MVTVAGAVAVLLELAAAVVFLLLNEIIYLLQWFY